MAKINFTCPHCKKPAKIIMIMRWQATISTELVGFGLSKHGKTVDAWPQDKSIPEEEMQKDCGELEQFKCSECGEELGDDSDAALDSENALAAFLDAKGMLIRDKDEPKGPITSPDDSEKE